METEGRTKKQKAAVGILAGWDCSNCAHQDRVYVNLPLLHVATRCSKNLIPSKYGWCNQYSPVA